MSHSDEIAEADQPGVARTRVSDIDLVRSDADINLVQIDHLTKIYGDFTALSEMLPARQERRSLRSPRAQWRWQDNLDPPDAGLFAADFRILSRGWV